jgi:hypothetical protein
MLQFELPSGGRGVSPTSDDTAEKVQPASVVLHIHLPKPAEVAKKQQKIEITRIKTGTWWSAAMARSVEQFPAVRSPTRRTSRRSLIRAQESLKYGKRRRPLSDPRDQSTIVRPSA